jgi:hypothetical protein
MLRITSADSRLTGARPGSLTIRTVRRSLDVDGTFKMPKNRAAKRTLKLTPRALDALKLHKVRQNAERLRAGSRW